MSMKKRMLCAMLLVSCWCLAQPSQEAADTLYRAHKWKQAAEAYEELIPNLEGNEKVSALRRLGYCWERQQKQYDKAIAAYRQALEVKGGDPGEYSAAQLRIGYCIKSQQKLEESIPELMKVLEIPGADPTHQAEALLYAGWSYNSLERYDEAVATMRRSTAVEEAHGGIKASAWFTIGRIREGQGQYEEALEAYEQVLAGGANHHQKAHAESHMAEIRMLLKGDLPFYIKPWVNDATGSEVEIVWVSQGESSPGTATLTANGQTFSATAELSPLKNTTCQRQAARLTGLQPNIHYDWTVTCGGESRSGTIRTSPPPGEPVVISATGDTQSQPDLHLAVAEEMAEDEPDVVLHVGDLTDRGAIWGRWRMELFDPAWPYLQQALFLPCSGNHDGGPYFSQLFDIPGGQLYYAKRYGDVLIVALDSYWSGASRSGREKQLEWLRMVLSESDAKWKVVNVHVPMIATDPRLKWFGEEDFAPLLEELGVDLVVCGHHPRYRRYLGHGDPGEKPVIHITTGGGGPVGGHVPSPAQVVGAEVQHHTTLRVHGNRMEITAEQPDGTVIDHLILEKDAEGNFQPEIMAQRLPLRHIKAVRHLYMEMLLPRSFNLQADVDQRPEAGKPLTVTLDVSKFPRGGWKSEQFPDDLALVIRASSTTNWQVSEQRIDPTSQKLTFTAIPPDGVGLSTNGFEPPLEVEVNFALGDHLLVPHNAEVLLHAESQRLLKGTD